MIRWRTLVTQFWLAPGTRRIRLLLVAWEIWLMHAAGLALLLSALYYHCKVARTLRDDPEFARAWAIRQRTKSSYRSRRSWRKIR